MRRLSFLPVPQHPLSMALSRGFSGKQDPLNPFVSPSAAASSQRHFIHRFFRKCQCLMTPNGSPRVAEPHRAGAAVFASRGLSMNALCHCSLSRLALQWECSPPWMRNLATVGKRGQGRAGGRSLPQDVPPQPGPALSQCHRPQAQQHGQALQGRMGHGLSVGLGSEWIRVFSGIWL